MKPHIMIYVFSATAQLPLSAMAEIGPAIKHGVTNDGLVAYVEQFGRGEREQSDWQGVYGFFTATGAVITLHVPVNPSFKCRIDLFDSEGKPIPKTKLGETYGRRFTELRPIYEDKKQTIFREMDLHLRTVGGVGTSGYPLPSPAELFAIKNQGTYRLKLQFQVLRPIQRAGKIKIERVRFAPIEYE